MIITISGNAGSGKSTVGKIVSKKLGLKRYSTGDFMRQMAEERGITLLELSKLAEFDRKIDEELDMRQIELGKNEDNFIIDARLGFKFIPNSIKIFLYCELDESARRIFNHARSTEKNESFEQTKENIKTRQESERKRYKEYYNLENYMDEKHYDLVVDTTNISPEEVAKKIFEYIETIKE